MVLFLVLILVLCSFDFGILLPLFCFRCYIRLRCLVAFGDGNKGKIARLLTDVQRECIKYDNIFGSLYDHYYLNCGELTSLDDPEQETPPWYYGLLDEEDYALIDKVQPKQKRPRKTTIRGLNS